MDDEATHEAFAQAPLKVAKSTQRIGTDIDRSLHLDSDHSSVRRFEHEVHLVAVTISPVVEPSIRVCPGQLPRQFTRHEGLEELARDR